MIKDIIIRKAIEKDVPAMMQLVLELAVYEKGLHEVTNNEAQMLRDGFGEHPAFGAIVAEDKSSREIVGISIYYIRYSTWKGRRLYLEDLVVSEKNRGQGIGKLLFEETINIAKELQCNGMLWQVLDWNEPAINFYKKYQARFDEEWLNVQLEFNT